MVELKLRYRNSTGIVPVIFEFLRTKTNIANFTHGQASRRSLAPACREIAKEMEKTASSIRILGWSAQEKQVETPDRGQTIISKAKNFTILVLRTFLTVFLATEYNLVSRVQLGPFLAPVISFLLFHHNRTITMTTREKDLEVEKGCSAPLLEGPTKSAAKPSAASKSFPLWKIAAAILALGLVVFAIAFPVVRSRDDHNNNNNNNTSGGSGTIDTGNEENSPSTSQAREYTSTGGPFNVTLGLFSKEIVGGYSDSESLENDLSNAAMFLLNGLIKRNTGQIESDSGTDGGPKEEFAGEGAPVAADGGTGGDSAIGDLDEFGQNNQEDDVEEGDMMVSNGAIGTFVLSN
jgi:hypothetical protein